MTQLSGDNCRKNRSPLFTANALPDIIVLVERPQTKRNWDRRRHLPEGGRLPPNGEPHCSGLHFAGECLDIDGITGGFNFQAAWTAGRIAGMAMIA